MICIPCFLRTEKTTTQVPILKWLSYWFIPWNHLISWEPIFVDGGILAYLLRCNFADASVLIFSRKTNFLWLVFLDVNSLVRATHEYHENWATSRSNYSTVYHKHEVYIYYLGFPLQSGRLLFYKISDFFLCFIF